MLDGRSGIIDIVSIIRGGGGYTLLQGMLKLFAKHGLNDTQCEPEHLVARCLRLVFGIGLMDTRDDHFGNFIGFISKHLILVFSVVPSVALLRVFIFIT